MNRVTSKRKIRIFIIILCLFFMMIGAVALRFRGGHVVSANEDVVPAVKIVLYRQDDERWADETLGDSGYTMGKSGCLVSCIASAVTMTKGEKTPHTLNEEFSAHNVFDAEGNILWDALRNTGEYEVDVYKEATEELLIECLRDGTYPIARVRMYGLGNFHYVLIVKAENGEFYCMDPLEDELTKLSKYSNRIYAVRCVSPAEY
ncbi:MAG: hypothetical protein K2O59_00100 [Lachnospiraceae bacterium]|nr:hypothetical protein [Lachnospiraceae bacterium]